ncbi:UNVERIFIED_CONTAM: hypothetical protein GTU68_041997 [Idotea baltica]|nr:hypothetical protein [Idotea baltica]
MSGIIIIPARMGSTRFHGKPLAKIKSKEMIYRTWALTQDIGEIDDVIISTESEELSSFVKSFGAKAIITSDECTNGTERVHETLLQLDYEPDYLINLQGDAVLTPPWVISKLCQVMAEGRANFATTCVKLENKDYEFFINSKKTTPSSGSTVVFDKDKNALYFSKSLIPFSRIDNSFAYRHIGIYAYTPDVLKEYLTLKPSPLELSEGIEVLRALENNIKVKVIEVDYKGRTHWSVDNPEDIEKVEKIIEQEGELSSLLK